MLSVSFHQHHTCLFDGFETAQTQYSKFRNWVSALIFPVFTAKASLFFPPWTSRTGIKGTYVHIIRTSFNSHQNNSTFLPRTRLIIAKRRALICLVQLYFLSYNVRKTSASSSRSSLSFIHIFLMAAAHISGSSEPITNDEPNGTSLN